MELSTGALIETALALFQILLIVIAIRTPVIWYTHYKNFGRAMITGDELRLLLANNWLYRCLHEATVALFVAMLGLFLIVHLQAA